ncbi:MAG: DUF4883 family protein [Sarcina sp.]
MKKNIYLLLVIFIFASFSFMGCSLEEYINVKEKPNELYYTEQLLELINKKEINIRILETGFYKEIVLKEKEISIIKDFTTALKKEQSYSKMNKEEIPEKALYKIYIESKDSKEKFIIDVYGDDFISIFPWDGNSEKDWIKLTDIPTSLKPESLCKYMLTL